MIRAVQEQRHTRRRAALEFPVDAGPTRRRGVGIRREIRAQLIPGAGQVIGHDAFVPSAPVKRIALAAAAAPDHDKRLAEAGGDVWQGRRVAKRIRAIQHRRRFGTQVTHSAGAGQQVAHQPFAAGNQFVREDKPRTGFEPTPAQRRTQFRGALGSDAEIILEHNGLPIEQKAGAGGRVIEEFIDEWHEPLPESFGRVVPLPVPVCVGDDVNQQLRVRGAGCDRGVQGTSFLPQWIPSSTCSTSCAT